MIRVATLVFIVLGMLALPASSATAASFDCERAGTPFEHAICDSDELSAADDRLARTYATATGGLSETALGILRTSQRDWLSYADRACTETAVPLTSGRYDEAGVTCLVGLFNSRSGVLEASRMIEGLRFYPVSRYVALPDPDAEEGSSWAVAEHELTYVQLDETSPMALQFNDTVAKAAEAMLEDFEPDAPITENAGTDSSNGITVEEIAGSGRITLRANGYWYGHGAAHGNYTIEYLHFLTEEGRFLEAEDLFSGKKWQQALLDLAVEALRAEHGDMLMLDDTQYIEESVADPRRWVLSDPYGLEIQFQIYEVAAYAYGAPTATVVSWEALAPYLTENADKIRYGF